MQILKSIDFNQLANDVTAKMNAKEMWLPCGNLYFKNGIYYQPVAKFNANHIGTVISAFILTSGMFKKCN